jgi:hypothetical protein
MATMFARHDVTDFAKWKAAYDAFDDERRKMGVGSHGIYRTEGNPNNVTVYHDFDSMDAAKAFASSPRLKEIMKDAGVSGTPEIWITDRV